MSVFSLPTQRCFDIHADANFREILFSAYAEVFLCLIFSAVSETTFLCLRRGVSKGKRIAFFQIAFSLPTQRCFLDAE